MDNCTNCANSIFNEKWGEYKCKVREITIPKPYTTSCGNHKKKQEEKSCSKD